MPARARISLESMPLNSVIKTLRTPEVELTIICPEDGGTAPIDVYVEGWSTGDWLIGGYHLHVVVEYVENMWPQRGEVFPLYSAKNDRYEFACVCAVGLEGDAGKELSIKAILVNDEVHELVQEWFRKGAATGDWVPIPENELYQWGGVRVMDEVRVTRT